MSEWLYTGVTVHFEATENSSCAASGAYIFNKISKDYFILTVSNISNPLLYNAWFTTKSMITDSEVIWLPLILQDYIQMKQYQDAYEFTGFIQDLVESHGFQFTPNENTDLFLFTFKLRPASTDPIINERQLSPLILKDASKIKVPSKISITCCPFSFTNVALFIDYRLHGSINFKISTSGFLSDCRYLADTAGGIVKLKGGKGESIGMVAGVLNKINGDGALLSIISWNIITKLLNYPKFKIANNNAYPVKSFLTSATSPYMKPKPKLNLTDSVVRISVNTEKDEKFWGSGVILSNQYIVTNDHVLKLNVLTDLNIHTTSGVGIELHLSDFDIIKSPILGYDLCFLKLRVPNDGIRPVKMCQSYKAQIESLRIGKAVKSIGYGLIYGLDYKSLVPFHSEGFISTLVPLEIDSGYTEPALIIASASCWNGSSGGGLFNKKDELIGIMSSNGKLSSGEILPDFTLAIPITIIDKCIFMIEHGFSEIDASQKIKDLWGLKSTTHQHKIIPSKL